VLATNVVQRLPNRDSSSPPFLAIESWEIEDENEDDPFAGAPAPPGHHGKLPKKPAKL
jgi:hypothetical protein